MVLRVLMGVGVLALSTVFLFGVMMLIELTGPEPPRGPRCNQAGGTPMISRHAAALFACVLALVLVADVLLVVALFR